SACSPPSTSTPSAITTRIFDRSRTTTWCGFSGSSRAMLPRDQLNRNSRGRRLPSPVDHRAVILVVTFRVLPGVADLAGQGGFAQLDAEARGRRHVHESALQHERLLQIAFAERAVFLTEEVRDRGSDLDAGSERDRAERVVRGDGRVVRLGQAG